MLKSTRMFCRPLQPVLGHFRAWVSAMAWGLLAFGGGSSEAANGTVEVGGDAYRIKHWTTEEGLPQNRIGCLKQTLDGYLWIGTWNGLVRFDGAQFTVFNKFNTPELVNDAINALAQDAGGTLWIGTHDGLVSYREHRFQRFTMADGLPDRNVVQAINSHWGGVWLQAGDAVVRLDHEKFSESRLLDLSGGRVLSIHEWVGGWLDIITTRAWLTLSAKSGELRTNYALRPKTQEWGTALPAKGGFFWIGTTFGLQRLEERDLQSFPTNGLCQGLVDFVYEDGGSNLWITVRQGGLYMWDHSGWAQVDLGEGLGRSYVVCMEEDLEGNLWLGTDHGLVQLQKQAAYVYTARDGLADDNVLSVCEGSDGTIWAGTDKGLSCIRQGRVARLGPGEPVPGGRDLAVWPRRDGGVWCGNAGEGIFTYKGTNFTDVFAINGISGSLNALYEDRSGRLWVGTQGGAAAFQKGQFDNPCEILQSPRDVRCILEDREGVFWFGTLKQGLLRRVDGKMTSFTERDGLSNNSVWSLVEDSDGTVWIGTDNGLTRYRNGRLFAFRKQHGLPEGTVNCVLCDDFGCLWLSGLHGVHRAQRAQLNAVADGRESAAEFVTLGTADGMANPETNGGENQPAGWKARNGRLWFPTVQGLVVIDPKAVPVNERPPPVVLEQVKADKEVVYGDELANARSSGREQGHLKTGNAKSETRSEGRLLEPAAAGMKIAAGHGLEVEFKYTANSFVAPERVRFRYRLIGADQDWRDTHERFARYVNLRPGDYRFEVVAANHHNVWNLHPATFAVSLAPFLWQTWPFYVLCAGIILGLAGTAHAYRIRLQRQVLKLEEQRAVANERTRIARDLHDDLGASLTGIALQLEAAQKRGGAAGEPLASLASEARAVAHDLRELAWTTNPRCDNAVSLVAFIAEVTERFCKSAGLDCRLELPETDGTSAVPARVRHELLMVLKESLANIGKHAAARNVTVSLAMNNGDLRLAIKDDGRGFDTTVAAAGSGLRNLRERLQQTGGSFTVDSRPETGTTFTAVVPVEKK